MTEEGERFRVATVQAGSGAGLILAQPLAANDRTLEKLGGVLFVFGALGVLAALLVGWLVARNGLRPVRRLTSRVEHIADHRGPATAARWRATTRSPGWPPPSTRCCSRSAPPATASAASSPTPATSCVRRSRRCAPTSTCSARPRATRRCRPRPGSSCSTTSAARSRSSARSSATWSSSRATSRTTRVVAEVDLADVVERAVTRVRRRAQGVVLRRRPRPVAGRRRRQQPRAGGHQPARQRRQVEPAGGHRHRAAGRRRAHRRRPGHRASPRPTGPTSSSASTAPRSRGRCPAPASAWPSCAR